MFTFHPYRQTLVVTHLRTTWRGLEKMSRHTTTPKHLIAVSALIPRPENVIKAKFDWLPEPMCHLHCAFWGSFLNCDKGTRATRDQRAAERRHKDSGRWMCHCARVSSGGKTGEKLGFPFGPLEDRYAADFQTTWWRCSWLCGYILVQICKLFRKPRFLRRFRPHLARSWSKVKSELGPT